VSGSTFSDDSIVNCCLVVMSECVGANTRHPSGENVPRQSSSSLLRSRSSQSLRPSHDHVTAGPAADDRLTVLVQMFWISVSLLESDFEYEFLLAVQLLDKVTDWTSISLCCHSYTALMTFTAMTRLYNAVHRQQPSDRHSDG